MSLVPEASAVRAELYKLNLMSTFASCVCLQIRMSLVAEAAAVRAELYKLNLMEKGDFFKPHKDTPRGGDTCFGTLVVALPVPFKGE
jgi:hypothetical protein